MKQLLNDFLSSLKDSSSPATIKNYQFYIKRFFNWGNLSQPEQITAEKVEKFRQYLGTVRSQRGQLMKATTQNYHLIAIRSFLDFLKKQGVSSLGADQVFLNKAKRPRPADLGKNELEKLLSAPLNAKEPGIIQRRDKAILELIFSAGLKVSEVASLKKNQLNPLNDQLIIRGKAGRLRTVPLTNQTKYWLKEYLDSRTDRFDAVFIRHDKAKKRQFEKMKSNDYRLTPRTIQRVIKKYAHSAEIKSGFTPEKLRQAYAQQLARQGLDIKSIQSLLGHASVSTTRLYTGDKQLTT